MIDEVFLTAAIGIKKKYYQLTSDLTRYEAMVEKTQDLVQNALDKVTAIDSDLHDPQKRKMMSNSSVMKEVDMLLAKLDEDAKRLEEYINPMNEGIEKLAIEEEELYRQITIRHPYLSQDDIVKSVSDRLKKEGLL